MQGAFGLVVFFGFTVLIIGLALLLSRWQAGRAREALGALARDLGLQLHEKPPALGLFPHIPTVSGRHGGRDVRFYNFTTGSGKHRQHWRALAVACANPRGLTFRLSTQSVFSKLGEMLGMQDVRVGHAAFDERFVVKTNAPEYLRAALLPEMRDQLLQLWSSIGAGANLKLEGNEIVYAELGEFADTKALVRMKAMLEPALALSTLPEVYGC